MTHEETLQRAQQLAMEIRRATGAKRLSFHREFSQLLNGMHTAGAQVPRALRQLETELCEEEAEVQFDNMPV